MKIGIEHYNKVQADGAFQGFFTLVIYPEAQVIPDCKHFKNERGDWFNFPSKEIEREGEETEYFPRIYYRNKEYLQELKAAVYDALQGINNGKNSKANPTESQVPSDTPPDWF